MDRMTSWGRLSHLAHTVMPLSDRQDLPRQLGDARPGIAHGMGRSYGDICLNPGGVLWQTTQLDRFIQFDPITGLLVCESGVLLQDVQRLFAPQGWMLPVTPGTQLVTVGGAIANDVHGKNHHKRGSFGDHIKALTLLRTNGERIVCGPALHADWYAATVGGLGLTGIIVDATLQLLPASTQWLETESIAYSNLDEFFDLARSSESAWEHTVSWIDCASGSAGRGIFMRANPSKQNVECGTKSKSSRSMPFVPPISLVNGLSLRLFNSSYFHLKRMQATHSLTHYIPFFYPLDNLLNWNRMYGPKGFFQYQCVIPPEIGCAATQGILDEVARSGEGSFLAVLKTFGDRDAVGMLSFPCPGVTLALDFPNRGEKTLALFSRLDSIVREAKGRIYPAKDARMPRELFESGYPRLNTFLPYRDAGISSALSRRLMGS